MNEPGSILLVEDAYEDAEAVTRSLRDAGLGNPIDVCEDGDSALDYLFGRGQYAGDKAPPRPSLILLDLSLPATDGRDVLREIKADGELKRIPVVVMTSSQSDRDIENAYAAGANSYVLKPVDLGGLVDAVRRLKEYWFGIVIFPRN